MTVERAAPFVERAHSYAGLGWALVRCDGKKPQDRGWETTKPEPPELVAGKWSHWGQRWNLGVICGPSGVAVLDVDRDDDPDRACLDLLGVDELPETPIVRTGRGRLQVYFRDPGGLAKHAREGFELRVGPHQCIAPPSVHPDTGRAHEWLPGRAPWEVELAELPAHLIDFFAATTNGDKPREVAEIIGPGGRHDALFSIAGTLRRRGLGETEILAALRAVNAERCRPPHHDAKLVDLAREIIRYEPATSIGASYLDADPGPEPRPLPDDGGNRFHHPDPAPGFEIRLRTTREICALTPPDGDELLGPLLRRGQRMVVGAHTGEGKTTLVAWIVASLVKKEPFLDWTGAGGRVLILDLEQGLRSVQRQLREVGLDDCDDVDYALIPEGLALNKSSAQEDAIEALLRDGNYAAVLLDPFYKASTGDSSDERAIDELMRLFDAWRARYGFAFVLPAHCRKPAPGALTAFSIHDIYGSTAFLRGAEIVLGLRRVSDGYSRLYFFKDRDGDLPVPENWGLLFERTTGYRRDPKDGAVRDLQAELLEALADGEWRTVNELRAKKQDGGIGADRKKIQPILEELAAEGGPLEYAVGPTGRKANAKCFRLVASTPHATYATSLFSTDSPGADSGSGVLASPYLDDSTTPPPPAPLPTPPASGVTLTPPDPNGAGL